MLAGAAGAEVVADQEDLAAGHPGPVEDERRVLERAVLVEAPVAEERVGEAVLVGDLEVAGRDDLVRVDVLGRQRHDLRGERAEALGHRQYPPPTVTSRSTPGSVRGSVTTPVIAEAAAVSGEARNVRPPLPWRPSKLRFDVLIAYWPGELVAVHGDAHRAAGLAPLGAGGPEDLVQALALGLRLHLLGARDDHHARALVDVAVLEHARRRGAGR